MQRFSKTHQRKPTERHKQSNSVKLTKTEKLLGHVIRASEDDQMRRVTLAPGTSQRADRRKTRQYGPRQNWVKETNKYVWTETH